MARTEPKKDLRQPKFYSLFVPPNVDWFQKLIARKAAEGSLSDRLIDLAMKDLGSKKVLSQREVERYEKYKETKPEIKRTRFADEKEEHLNFSLYLPKKKEQQWIRGKLDPVFLERRVGAKSRSHYLWNLLVEENVEELTAAQIREWKEKISTSTSGKKKGSKNKVA